jgi:AraC family transcriptional regulator
MEILADARIVMWEGAGLWVVDAKTADTERKRTDFHAHHALQVTISLGGHFKLGTKGEGALADAVAVAPDVEHVFAAEGLVAFVFIEPESRLGRAAARRLLDDKNIAAIAPDLLGDCKARLTANFRTSKRDDATLIGIGRDLVARLASDAKADVPDLRIRKVIAWAGRQLDAPVSLADAAGVSDLSESRLRHLFVEQTGLPFKTYLLWLRLTRALEAFASGRSLTEAAHASGFSDSAHLSRTFRRMFGVAPSALRMS